MSDQICILFGALRSGTTLLRLMIDGHPAISCPGEADFIFDFVEKRDGVWRYDWARLEEHRIYKASVVTRPEGLDGRAATAHMIGQLAGAGAVPVVSMHRGLDKAAEMFPDARVLHLLRDPRDVARSSIGMGWAAMPYFGVDHWIGTERDYDRAVPGFATSPLEIRYEDLIAEPEHHLTEIARFFGMDWDPAMLSYDQRSSYSAPDASLVYQWKSKQTKRDVALTEAKLGPMLGAKGYAPSGYPAVVPGTLDRALLTAQNKIGTWRKAVRRYGFANIAQRRIGRALGLEAMRRGAQARIDAITVRDLK